MAANLGRLNAQYVSTLQFVDGSDIHSREVLAEVLNITNEDYSFLDVLELMGRTIETKATRFQNFTNQELYATVQISSSSDQSGGSGQGDVDITLVGTSGTLPVRKGDIVLFKNKQTGYVYDINATGGNVISVKAVDDSVTTVGLSVVNGEYIAILSNANGEGSGQRTPQKYGIDNNWNQVQIFKDMGRVTDLESAGKVEFEFQGQPYYMYKVQNDTLMRFKADISNALMFSQRSAHNWYDSTPTLADSDSNPVATTQGMYWYIENDGINESGATVNLALYQSLARSFAARRCNDPYAIFCGTEQMIAHDSMLLALNNSVSVSENARLMVGQDSKLDLVVKSFTLHGKQYHLRYLPLLDHKNLYNFSGSAGLEKTAFYVPLGKIKTTEGAMVDRIRCRYMRSPKNNFAFREYLTGGLAPVPTDSTSVLDFNYEAILGLEILGPDHFAKVELT